MRSSQVHWHWLNSSSPGVSAIFVLGVDLLANNILLSLVCTVPFDPSNFFIRSLKMWTDLNTWPLEEGYPWAVSTCKIPFLVKFFTSESCAIVWNCHVWQSIGGKNSSKQFYSSCCTDTGCWIHLHPLTTCINHNKKEVPYKCPSMVYV